MSSDPLDTQSIDIDYKKPTHQVIHQAITYLLQMTPLSVHEILNLMYYFKTLETTFFVLPFEEEEATEILFPHLQSGNLLNLTLMPEEPDFMSQGIPVVDDPALLLFEKRLESKFKEDETCHNQVVRLMLGREDSRPRGSRSVVTMALGSLTNESRAYEKYEKELRVISWGSPEHRVKIVVIHNREKAIVQAALQGCGHVVKHLLHLKVRDEEREKLEEEVLREVVDECPMLAIQTILDQITHVNIQGGQYDKALQIASSRRNEQVVKLLLDKGANVNAQGGHYGNALQAASYKNSEQVIKLLLDNGANVNAQGGHYGNALQAASSGISEEVLSEQIVKLLLDRGANVNAQGGHYGNALKAALRLSNMRIASLLRNQGANTNVV
jgi:RNA binding exosome subunit